METTFTEYHFIQTRKSFEDWLLDRLAAAVDNELIEYVIFDFSAQTAALFVKYVCECARLLPPDTPKQLFELDPEGFAKIAAIFFAATLAEASVSDEAISPATLEEFRVASSELFSEDISAWLELASKAGNVSSFVSDAKKRIQQRVDESLSIPSNWWGNHPYEAENWASKLSGICTLLRGTGEKALSYSDPLVRHNARSGFSSLLEFTAELYRQRADDIPNSNERELTDIVVETTLAFLADTFFLKYLPQDFYQDLGRVKPGDLLRVCGFVYLNASFFLSVAPSKQETVLSNDHATWLFGLSEEDCQPYTDAAEEIAVDPTWSKRKPEFLWQASNECHRIFGTRKQQDPVLGILWMHLFFAVATRISLLDSEERGEHYHAQLISKIEELCYPESPEPRARKSQDALEKVTSACQHFMEIRDQARRQTSSRAATLMRRRDSDFLREITLITAAHLTTTIYDEPCSLAFYDHLSSVTLADVTRIFGLAYLDTVVVFAHFDRRNLVTGRLLKHVSQVFGISPDVVALHKDLANRLRKGAPLEDVQTLFQPALRDLFAPAMSLHSEYIQRNCAELLSSLGRILEHSEQLRRVRKQGDNLGCLGSFLGLLAIALVILGFAFFVWWHGR